jgi:hypothetical protein
MLSPFISWKSVSTVWTLSSTSLLVSSFVAL